MTKTEGDGVIDMRTIDVKNPSVVEEGPYEDGCHGCMGCGGECSNELGDDVEVWLCPGWNSAFRLRVCDLGKVIQHLEPSPPPVLIDAIAQAEAAKKAIVEATKKLDDAENEINRALECGKYTEKQWKAAMYAEWPYGDSD